MNTPFGRAFRYEMKNYFRAVAVLWLVMALLPAAMLALAYFLAGETAMESSFNGYSIAVGMFGLILGMTGSCALLLLISVLASVGAVMP